MERMERSPGDRSAELEGEIAGLRTELGVVVREVGRRARQSMNVKRQIQSHPSISVLTVALLTGVIVFAVAYPVYRRRRRKPPSRLRNLRFALAHLMAHPEDVQYMGRPRAGDKLLSAGTDVASFAAKKAVGRWLKS